MALDFNYSLLRCRVPYHHQPVLRAGYDTLSVLGYSDGEDLTATRCCPRFSTVFELPISKRAFVSAAYDLCLIPQEGDGIYGVSTIDFDDSVTILYCGQSAMQSTLSHV